jgi:hypothetical protein
MRSGERSNGPPKAPDGITRAERTPDAGAVGNKRLAIADNQSVRNTAWRSAAAFAIVASLHTETSYAQTAPDRTWRELLPTSASAPEPRRNGVAIYDPVGRRVVIFGGISGSGHLNDTWAFDLQTQSWTRLDTRGTPPAARLGHDAVYDAMGHQMIVWAGQDQSRFFNDTWALDLTSLAWQELSPSSRPQARYGSASVFDPVERRLVTFAGFTDLSRRFQDTQAFDLDTNTWEDLTPRGDKPEVRCLLTAAYDAAGHRMIMYGGQRSGPLDDIWAFDFGTRSWTSLTPSERPAGRFFAASFLDRRQRFYVFGGATARGDEGETWVFDLASARWSRLEIPGPPPRNGMLAAYVDDRDSFVVFGGVTSGRLYSDVWELLPITPQD